MHGSPSHATANTATVANESVTRRGTLMGTTALMLLPCLAGTAFADDAAARRYADFADLRATVHVAGAAIHDPARGYTAECRIWIDAIQPTANSAFPGVILFQHESSVDHKWLGLDSGRATGLAVGSCRSWWANGWIRSADPIPVGRWVHLAHVVRGGIDRIYVDGVLRGSSPDACTDRQNGSHMQLGSAPMADMGATLDSFRGKLDWIRISSVARYGAADFTVPTEESLVPDADTKLLVTFNGTGASDAFVDLSPNHFALSPGQGISGGAVPAIVPDCNGNGLDDRTEIAQGTVVDSNGDGVPDTCQCGSIPQLPACCPGDVAQDGVVDGADLALILANWGPTDSTQTSRRCDLDGNGTVDGSDLGALLSAWGPCHGPNVPAWAILIETNPDPVAVTDPALRAAIIATGLPWRVRDRDTGIEMALVPPGSFRMGCTTSDTWGCFADESPTHDVTLTHPFYMGRTEVTQAQWIARVGSNPAYFSNANGQPGSDDRPVERVSWNDVQGFLAGTGMRLPTEAEWEYAYRAGTSTAYHGWPAQPGGTNADGAVGPIAWHIFNTCYADGCGSRPVGLKACNGFGLHDMSGNVWEWVSDWYGGYGSEELVDPAGPASGSQRVLRGGSWFNSTPAYNVRASVRGALPPGDVRNEAGFRVVREP